MIKFAFNLPFIPSIVKSMSTVKGENLEKEVFGIKFPNPVGLAAGLDKNADYFHELSNLGFGFVEIGTVTPVAQTGNPKPRLFRLIPDKGIINRMGFNNKGLQHAVSQLKKRRPGVIVGANIGKNTSTPNEQANNDYFKCLAGLYEYADYFVINVSCPNVKDLHKLQDKDSMRSLLVGLLMVRQFKKVKKPLLVKVSPDLEHEQVDEMVDLVTELNFDGMVVTNTTTSRAGLSTSDAEISKIGNGGLSGKPLTNKSTELISYISKRTKGKLPIIGVGGIMCPADAIEKLNAGASLVQVYTGFIYEGPALIKNINKEIEKLTKN